MHWTAQIETDPPQNAEIMEWNNFYMWHHCVLFFIVTAGGLPIHISHIFNEVLE
jgi:hypothetical protein